MNYQTCAAVLLERVRTSSAAPGFEERLTAALGSAQGARSIAAPYYLTDLGVRRFTDPRIFFTEHLALFGAEGSDCDDDYRTLIEAPIQELADHLDQLILLTGDYDTAQRAAVARWSAVLEDDTVLLVHAGVLFAGTGDPRARVLFQVAAETAVSTVDRFTAMHRLAATEIKRWHHPEEGLRLLEQIDRAIDAARTELSGADRATLLSVTANLRALAFIRSDRPDEARQEITRSLALHSLDGLHVLRVGEASRYGAQERINLGQVLYAAGDPAAAVAALEDNLEYCRAHNPDYVSEALSALAYGHLLAADVDASISTARHAARLIAFEASPVRLRAAREIEIAALAAAGHAQDANAAAVLMTTDPLGLTLSRPTALPMEVR